jgi:hypothetical protein
VTADDLSYAELHRAAKLGPRAENLQDALDVSLERGWGLRRGLYQAKDPGAIYRALWRLGCPSTDLRRFSGILLRHVQRQYTAKDQVLSPALPQTPSLHELLGYSSASNENFKALTDASRELQGDRHNLPVQTRFWAGAYYHWCAHGKMSDEDVAYYLKVGGWRLAEGLSQLHQVSLVKSGRQLSRVLRRHISIPQVVAAVRQRIT